MIYIDNECKCYTEQNSDGTLREIDKELFPGMCKKYIEGYRYIPSGESWTRSDGVVFSGEMIAPWQDWRKLDAAQREYEREQLAAYDQALSEIEAALGVSG